MKATDGQPSLAASAKAIAPNMIVNDPGWGLTR